jgi:hypothetical protein
MLAEQLCGPRPTVLFHHGIFLFNEKVFLETEIFPFSDEALSYLLTVLEDRQKMELLGCEWLQIEIALSPREANAE